MDSRMFERMIRQPLVVCSLGLLLGGCLPSAGVDTPSQKTTTTPGTGQNAAPSISGSPVIQLTPGQNYSFQPIASDPEGDSLSFTVQRLPGWANFNSSTGGISGTPGTVDVATYSGISISVSDGQNSATLGPFSITVDAIALGSAPLAWTPPTVNTDGSPLTDLAGYRIYWGQNSGNYDQSITITNPGLTSYIVDNLTAGNWYFVSTAVNSLGVESSYSNEAVKVVQ